MIIALHIIYRLLAKYRNANHSTLQNTYFVYFFPPYPERKRESKDG